MKKQATKVDVYEAGGYHGDRYAKIGTRVLHKEDDGNYVFLRGQYIRVIKYENMWVVSAQ